MTTEEKMVQAAHDRFSQGTNAALLDVYGPPKPPPGRRLVLVGEDVLAQWGTRTESGMKITAVWGEPDENGWYEPIFTVTDDGKSIVNRVDLEEMAMAIMRPQALPHD